MDGAAAAVVERRLLDRLTIGHQSAQGSAVLRVPTSHGQDLDGDLGPLGGGTGRVDGSLVLVNAAPW